MSLPTDAQARKNIPLFRGLLRYFPDALCAVAELSRIGNEQHNPGQPMHWAKEKSTDEADALMRHLIDSGTVDTDGVRHSTKVAWRALALLQRELDNARTAAPPAPPPSSSLRHDDQEARKLYAPCPDCGSNVEIIGQPGPGEIRAHLAIHPCRPQPAWDREIRAYDAACAAGRKAGEGFRVREPEGR